MKGDNVVATPPTGLTPRCLHGRMFESMCEFHGHKTDMVKCCECGAFVVIHLQHAEVS